jgi:succinate dehydrogenase hydrophobic anchor subunit
MNTKYNLLCGVLVAFSVCCMIVAAGIMYYEYRNDVPGDQLDLTNRRAAYYDTTAFIFCALVVIIHYVLCVFEREPYALCMWRYLYFGIVTYILIFGANSIIRANTARQAYQNDGKPAWSKKTLAALIIGYAGLWIGMWTIHGPVKIRSFLSVIIYIVAVILAVIGVVILWCLDDQSVQFLYLSFITVPLILILLFLSGPIFHEFLDGGGTAVYMIGLFGLWFLSQGFLLRDALYNDNQSSGQVHKAWAGSLFCWFSAWVALIAARFAMANALLPAAAPPADHLRFA